MNANKLSLCQHFLFEKKESLLVCSECSLSLDLDAVHNSNKIRGNKKITTDEELYLAAHAYLDVMAKAKHAAPLVVNESNVRISGQMLEDAGVAGAKAPGKIKSLSDDCYHSSVEWRLQVDGWGSAFCRHCGVNLSKYFGAKKRSSAPVNELIDRKIKLGPVKESTHNKSHGDASARPMDIVEPWEGEKKTVAQWVSEIPYKNVPAKSEGKVKVRYKPWCVVRDESVEDNRRERVDLRTDAQIAHARAVLRLRQHKLARWGLAEHVRWEEEL